MFLDLVTHMMRTLALMRTLVLASAMLLAAVPARAQVDLTGNWVSRMHEDWEERGPGPEAVDYLGLPINAEGRARALSYSTSALSLPERQCLYYPPHYVVLGPQGVQIWPETDPVNGRVIAWKISAAIDRSIITIWMDGRPHPPDGAIHTFAGFTTGEWRGNTLTAYTTHIKEGYLRRNGVPSSDKTTFTLHLSRHGDLLTILGVFYDPVYLTEPHVISRTWQLTPGNVNRITNPCVPEAELPGLQGNGAVPHYLPGQNPAIDFMTQTYHLPREAVLGGAETMYPEFRKRLGSYVPPDKCGRYCCGWGGAPGQTAPGLRCVTGGTGQINER